MKFSIEKEGGSIFVCMAGVLDQTVINRQALVFRTKKPKLKHYRIALDRVRSTSCFYSRSEVLEILGIGHVTLGTLVTKYKIRRGDTPSQYDKRDIEAVRVEFKTRLLVGGRNV